ncbi:Glycoside hydrolase, family 19, catalytic [uncultured Caudovirales phage]|uniref:Glycoside hydrolase, family 19, catalytic n=1 Tax=uncultured Caudovirales phage TaxID=2100421 RepID=A0A6J5KR31_9CAUD|nr:Glycoside hydrolase, family 19, catalytic [uncultured Caudovirales phage]
MPTLADDLRALSPKVKPETIKALADAASVLDAYEINTPLRKCHFWAQACHESGGFRHMHEIWGPSPAQKGYEGRKNLGNTVSGDGYLFRGRGLFQLTGRANYKSMSEKIGVDLLKDPEKAADPSIALKIACEYWKSHKLNSLADADDIVKITKRINGGTNGLEARKTDLAHCKKMWLHAETTPAPVPAKVITESKQANSAIVVGALGSVGAAKEIVTQVQEANDLFTTVLGLFSNPQFLMMAVVVGLGGAIWYWRKKHLEEHGV